MSDHRIMIGRSLCRNFAHHCPAVILQQPCSRQFLKETELKAALTGSTGRAKSSLPKKAQPLKKGKTLTLCSNLKVAEGWDVGGDEVADESEPEEPISSPCDSMMVSAL